jgi:hypothetical protein
VTDAAGNTNEPLAGSSYSPGLPDLNYDLGLNSVSLVTPTIQSFTLTFVSRGKPIAIQAFKGIGTERPDQAIRYLDLNLPPGTVAMLGLSPGGIADLVYDADGDGVFESRVNPTSSVIGESAWDSEPPVITFSEVVIGGQRLLSLVPTDNKSGVRTVKYSFDGQQYETYGGPLDISGCGLSAIYAFADDNVANRSEVFTYELPNQAPDVHAARPSLATLWPPAHRMVDISILGVADPDCDPFSIAITAVTQDESTNGSGDGATCPDAEIVDGSTVRVRAERNGGGDGRVYTIRFAATDTNGNVSSGIVKVSVPVNRNRQAVSGQLQFDSFRCDN